MWSSRYESTRGESSVYTWLRKEIVIGWPKLASLCVFVDQRGKILGDQGAKLEGNYVLNRKPVKCDKTLSRRFGARAVSSDNSHLPCCLATDQTTWCQFEREMMKNLHHKTSVLSAKKRKKWHHHHLCQKSEHIRRIIAVKNDRWLKCDYLIKYLNHNYVNYVKYFHQYLTVVIFYSTNNNYPMWHACW